MTIAGRWSISLRYSSASILHQERVSHYPTDRGQQDRGNALRLTQRGEEVDEADEPKKID